jgi:nitrate/nitrite transport system ATP-binding protein
VTHDVDEAVMLSDRIVMMTNGPAATIGKILTVPFARPRDRQSLYETEAFSECRDNVLEFLEHPTSPSPSKADALTMVTSEQ